MPKAPSIEPFLLVLKDEDKGVFTVVGPMTDDTSWNDRVCKAQDQGQVSRYTANRALSRNDVIENATRFFKLRYVNGVFL